LAVASAITAPSVRAQQPAPATLRLTAAVNDFAGRLTPTQRDHVEAALRAIRNDTGDAIVVVTVSALPPAMTIEDYALRVFNENGIGDRVKNNGLLILLAPTSVRIETGLGLERIITNEFAAGTVRQMIPHFRAGNIEAGLLAGIDAIGSRLRQARR
jgi:uncharacterized protein